MTIYNLSLRKLLSIMFMEPNKRRSAIRSDIRDELARDRGEDVGGPDFYGPFWRDAKDHAFGVADLHECVEQRVAAAANRSNLYPLLRDGFLLWWNERRRWTNEPFKPGRQLRGQLEFPELGATVKIDSVLSVRDANDIEHYVYPYFSPSPPLSDEAARLGLWALGEALDQINLDHIRILDTIRGQTFSTDKVRLRGDEQMVLKGRYEKILLEREKLREEY